MLTKKQINKILDCIEQGLPMNWSLTQDEGRFIKEQTGMSPEFFLAKTIKRVPVQEIRLSDIFNDIDSGKEISPDVLSKLTESQLDSLELYIATKGQVVGIGKTTSQELVTQTTMPQSLAEEDKETVNYMIEFVTKDANNDLSTAGSIIEE